MTALDRDALLAWLADRATHRSALVAAIYTGIADRIERGDFNQQEET